MKKLITLLLIAALAFTLFACSNTQNSGSGATEAEETIDTAAIRESFDKAAAYVDTLFDAEAEGMTTSVQDDENGEYLYKYWNRDENTGNDNITLDVEVGGETITIGKTLISDLKELGFEVDLDRETVEAKTVLGFSVTKGGKFCNMSIDNNSDAEVNVADLPISDATGTSEEFGALSFVYKDIKIGDDLKKVFDTLGVPYYNLNLSADSQSAVINAGYNSSVTEGDTTVSNTVSFDATYDAAQNTAKITNIKVESQSYPASDAA